MNSHSTENPSGQVSSEFGHAGHPTRLETGAEVQPDPHGERVSITKGQHRHEKLWHFPNNHMGIRLPLYPQFLGNAVWEAGISITRQNAYIFSMELVTHGSIEFTQNNRSYLAEPGQIFMLRKGSNHTYRTGPHGYAHKRILVIGGDLLSPMLAQMKMLEVDIFRPKNARNFADFIKKGAQVLQARPPGFITMLSELAYAALVYAGNEIKGHKYPSPVQLALDYMHQHLNGLPSLGEIAAKACLSTPHFCRVFHKHTGVAPMRYFRLLKIEEARNLLAYTTIPINEIALKLGYENAAYFSYFFAQETGKSPRAFRNHGS